LEQAFSFAGIQVRKDELDSNNADGIKKRLKRSHPGTNGNRPPHLRSRKEIAIFEPLGPTWRPALAGTILSLRSVSTLAASALCAEKHRTSSGHSAMVRSMAHHE
jgi:hypothetical protein